MDEEKIREASIEKLLEFYLQGLEAQEQLEASISVLKEEMILRLDAENVKGKVVEDYSITKVKRINFRTTIEEARDLGATRTVEQVDTQALKRLHDSGVEVPKTITTEFVMVKPLEKAETK